MIPEEVFEPTIPIYFRECRSNKYAKSLIIAFTSHGNHGKKYDLYKVLDSYNKAHQLFLSTTMNGFYFEGMSSTITESKTIEIIKELVEKYKIQNVITIGNSAGGVGAIIYGFKTAQFVKTSIVACAVRYNPMSHVLKYCTGETPFKNHFDIYVDFNFKLDYDAAKQLQPYLDLKHCEGTQHNVLKTLYLKNRLFHILDDEIHLDDRPNAIPEKPTVKEYYIQSANDEG